MSMILRPLKWFYHEFGIVSIHETGRNAWLIILARSCRMFAYGTNSLILAIFFSALNYSDHQIGIFMTLTLLGDVVLGTILTLIADRVGRRRVLMGGSLLMIMSGFVFAVFENFWILLAAAILGVISVTGGDFGPFRSIEESVLSQLSTPSTRADVLAWYVTTSTFGSSIGSEVSGRMIHHLQARPGWTDVDAYHALFWIYVVMGIVNVAFILLLTDACELHADSGKGADLYTRIPQDDQGRAKEEQDEQDEDDVAGDDQLNHDTHINNSASATATADIESLSPPQTPHYPSIHLPPLSSSTSTSTSKSRVSKATRLLTSAFSQISRPTLLTMSKLWFLLLIDPLADGMVPYSLTNYYMDQKFSPTKSLLGDVTSLSYFLGGIGAVFAGPLARRIGLINTMVFTHVPSSAAVLFFPLAPTFWLTALLLLVRTGLNNMDQAPRSAFIAAVVRPQERTAIMGITAMLRNLAAMCGPSVTGWLAEGGRFDWAFYAAGTCRLGYDFGLWALFVGYERGRKLQDRDADGVEVGHSAGGRRGDGNEDEDDDGEWELQSLVSGKEADDDDDDDKDPTKHKAFRATHHTPPPPLSTFTTIPASALTLPNGHSRPNGLSGLQIPGSGIERVRSRSPRGRRASNDS